MPGDWFRKGMRLYSSVVERQSCKLKVLGSIPSGLICVRASWEHTPTYFPIVPSAFCVHLQSTPGERSWDNRWPLCVVRKPTFRPLARPSAAMFTGSREHIRTGFAQRLKHFETQQPVRYGPAVYICFCSSKSVVSRESSRHATTAARFIQIASVLFTLVLQH